MVAIHKFGGTCTESFEKLLRVLQIIISQKYPIVITASAAKGVTDTILNILTKNESSEFSQLKQQLIEQHQKLLGDKEFHDPLSQEFDRFGRLLSGIEYTGEILPATQDLLVSFGERFISNVIHQLLTERFIKTKIYNPEDFIVTSNNFGNADVILDITKKKIKEIIEPNLTNFDVHVVPGFFGKSLENQVTLLGRSGTDYTATVLGYSLEAESVTIWKDVFGLMTGDPKIIRNAKPITQVSYKEAAELAYFGAKLLHPKAAEPARMLNLPLYICNLQNEAYSTLIQDSSIDGSSSAKSISFMSDMSLIRLFINSGYHSLHIIQSLIEQISQIHNPIAISASRSNLALVVKEFYVEEIVEFLRSSNHKIDGLEIEKELILVAIVGENIVKNVKLITSVLQILETNVSKVQLVTSGISTATYYLLFEQMTGKDVINQIHDLIFSN